MTSHARPALGSRPLHPKPPAPHAVKVRTVPSRDADANDLREAEQLVTQSFGKAFRDDDWRHGLGGTHVFVNDHTGPLIAHAAVVPRLIRHRNRTLHVGYVEAVAVRTDLQGRGLGGVVMNEVETIVRAQFQLGALNAIADAVSFYLHRGWTPWPGPTAAVDRAGATIITDNAADRIMLLSSRLQAQDISPNWAIMCDWRPGDLW